MCCYIADGIALRCVASGKAEFTRAMCVGSRKLVSTGISVGLHLSFAHNVLTVARKVSTPSEEFEWRDAIAHVREYTIVSAVSDKSSTYYIRD